MQYLINILNSYIVISMLIVIAVLFSLVVYYFFFVRTTKTSKYKRNSKFNLKAEVQEAEDVANDNLIKIMEKEGTGSSLIFFGLAFTLLIFGVGIGCYIVEYFILVFNSQYIPYTNAESASMLLIIMSIPFCIIIWIFIISFLAQSFKNLLK
ncbi:hypothetical protein [Cellulophaga sp. E6(2014)]|uniref:hypothetical protein n=1 Tax=Cellulophaga sp. E6(2014) TaxID=1495334 RepID=UPI00051DB9D7|nr:hypothetical protein [Cellulophaga sp. E6(2014)]KGK32215.1 hypothetical protein EL45_02760 [Cellulophaga sp. E6(2014)]